MMPGAAAYYLVLVPSLLVAITVHEFAHAWVAYRNGDPTAARLGRLSLNPLVHLDPLGTLGILFVGFGWGKPVPVNRSLLRHPRADLWVSAAGPLSNLAVAGLAAALVRVAPLWEGLTALGAAPMAALIVPAVVELNVMLAVFNFLPVGPLDGSHVVENLLPEAAAARLRRFNASYGFLLLLGLIVSGRVLPISPLSLLVGPPIAFFRRLFLGA